jgi:hypothetical protein
MQDSFTFHTDPGHGWLEVGPDDLAALGLSEASFSRFSYKHNGRFFLEEDCDASLFVQAYARANEGKCPQFIDNYYRQDCPIRRYQRINGRAHSPSPSLNQGV